MTVWAKIPSPLAPEDLPGLHCLPPAPGWIWTHTAFDPGHNFLWEAALLSSSGSVLLPLHKQDLGVFIPAL